MEKRATGAGCATSSRPAFSYHGFPTRVPRTSHGLETRDTLRTAANCH
ncbi:MAG: hypothetical protein AVDCRST_MAG64-4240 [uncultured Phycisphaerae bacterium]|uniref:Uncharacterized protein n=1 Tax=uncultured Phycisphaerae bacterium TaxID=904963 RepID=A0A6J4QFN1_9BACT|nr:MAG: hypothetical protein AVDCRST_MAG64-4240 [uncultured Phycisphaerae bacterium]